MSAKVFHVCIFLMVLLTAAVAWAQPRPISLSGEFEQGGLVRIYGQAFGPQPATGLAAGQGGSLDEPVFGLIVGDNAQYSECTIRRQLLLQEWNDGRIDAELDLTGLAEEQNFYFFIVDAQGQMSAAVGPWNLTGPVPAPRKPVAVTEMETGLAPVQRQEGVPYLSSWGPSGIGSPPVLSLYGENLDPDSAPQVVMGDHHTYGACSWLEPMGINELDQEKIFFPLVFSEELAGSIVYFFVVTPAGASNGLPLELLPLIPGQPPQPRLTPGN